MSLATLKKKYQKLEKERDWALKQFDLAVRKGDTAWIDRIKIRVKHLESQMEQVWKEGKKLAQMTRKT